MLDCETRRIDTPGKKKVISWSKDGKSFFISDVNDFSNSVLPKYFRTKKFSSFQRNLNLYGFTKVRRGPGTNIHAHAWFIKDQPESLLQLRKITAASRGGSSQEVFQAEGLSGTTQKRNPLFVTNTTTAATTTQAARAVSPSQLSNTSEPSKIAEPTNHFVLVSPAGLAQYALINLTAIANATKNSTDAKNASIESNSCPAATTLSQSCEDRGNLDLLALAMERELSRELST